MGIVNLIKNLHIKIKKFIDRKGWDFKRLPSVLSPLEKIIIMILIIVVLGTSATGIYSRYYRNAEIVPAYGGRLTEGILSDDLDKEVVRLLKCGLTRFDQQGNVQGDLAVNWEITNENKTYVFHLVPNVNASDIAAVISSHSDTWKDINVEVMDTSTIKFDLNQPYSPFLALATEPIFPYGPYILKEQSKKNVVLAARTDYHLGRPNIKEIEFILYQDRGKLEDAYNKGKIMAMGDEQEPKESYTVYQEKLPKYLVLFFNLRRSSWDTKDLREKLANNQPIGGELPLTLVTVDSPYEVEKAKKIKELWDPLGVKLNIVTGDKIDIQKNIIPDRNYDLLLYGIDYGSDPDPYPFWHSSQINPPGMNLSGFSSKDADRLLEQGRQITDEAKRAELYQNFQKILDSEKPAIFLEQSTYSYSISNKVKGVVAPQRAITSSDRFLDVSQWYIKTRKQKSQQGS